MENTLVITFNGTAYGVYLEWVPVLLLDDQPLGFPIINIVCQIWRQLTNKGSRLGFQDLNDCPNNPAQLRAYIHQVQ